MAKKTVAVIGAGMGGLAAIKHCLEAGLEPVAFEGEDDIGGVWRFTEQPSHSSAYRNLHINTGRDVNAFGDFPIPVEWPVCMPHTLMQRYLQMYADHFHLREHVRLRTRVTLVTPVPELAPQCQWAVEWEDLVSGVRGRQVFDAVMVCSGHHCQPRVPPFDGQDVFRGVQLHSHNYKDNAQFRGKRVVVIGLGNSGSDICTEVSQVAEATYLVSRRGSWIIANPFTEAKGQVASRFDSAVISYLPRRLQSTFVEKELAKSQVVANRHGLRPAHRFTQQHPTLTLNCPANNLFKQLESGTVHVKRNLTKLGVDTATFDDGETVPVDAVVYCTGYVYGHSFMDPALWHETGNNDVRLYNYMYMLNGCSTLSFIGLVQPLGAMVMIVDVQTRYAAKMLTGELKLPPVKKMVERTDATLRENLEWFVPSPRHTVQVSVGPYLDVLAEEMKVRPSLWRIVTQNLFAFRACFFCPTVAAHYRLVGPGKFKDAAANIWNEHKEVYKHSKSYTVAGRLQYWLFQLPLLLLLGTANQLLCLLTRGRFVQHHFA